MVLQPEHFQTLFVLPPMNSAMMQSGTPITVPQGNAKIASPSPIASTMSDVAQPNAAPLRWVDLTIDEPQS